MYQACMGLPVIWRLHTPLTSQLELKLDRKLPPEDAQCMNSSSYASVCMGHARHAQGPCFSRVCWAVLGKHAGQPSLDQGTSPYLLFPNGSWLTNHQPNPTPNRFVHLPHPTPHLLVPLAAAPPVVIITVVSAPPLLEVIIIVITCAWPAEACLRCVRVWMPRTRRGAGMLSFDSGVLAGLCL